jgi:predicted transcriptional regulator
MRVTIDHPSSSYGIPVILADGGELMDYAPGIKAIREKLSLSTQNLADACNVSRRTVEGWEQGRMPAAAALNVMGALLRKRR